MSSTILSQVSKQREGLKAFLQDNMHALAQQCAPLMNDPPALEGLLRQHVNESSK